MTKSVLTYLIECAMECFEENWDGENSKPISTETIVNTILLTDTLEKEDISVTEDMLCVLPNGKFNIVFKKENQYFSIDIENSYISYCLFDDKKVLVDFTQFTMDVLKDFLKKGY